MYDATLFEEINVRERKVYISSDDSISFVEITQTSLTTHQQFLINVVCLSVFTLSLEFIFVISHFRHCYLCIT